VTAAPGRDRDATGRARNARARDGLGRPLPRTAEPGTARIPDDLVISPEEAAALGQSLLAEGRPFHAHEVFEAAWKSGPASERDLWQGLAQIAVGITHARRGNPRGAVTLLRRGAERIRAYAATDVIDPAGGPAGGPAASGRRPHGIDLGFVTGRAEDLASRIEADDLASVPLSDFLLSLSPADLTPQTGQALRCRKHRHMPKRHRYMLADL
jgi:hypothetical protein